MWELNRPVAATALALWGLLPHPSGPVHITVARGASPRGPSGVRVHRTSGRLVSVRAGAPQQSGATKPHLGLGLFIVRLIAEFHHGQAVARNREDGKGVAITLRLPISPRA